MSPLEPPFSTLRPERPAPGLDRSPSQKRATARLWIAVAAGLCFVGLLALILLPALARITVDRGRPNTQNNMKVMGLVFKMYANESAGNRWPGLAGNERIWAPDLSEIYPEFLQDPSVLVAREHPDAEHIRKTLRAVLEGPNPDYETAEGLMALSFAYLGHTVKDEAGFQALVEARRTGQLNELGERIKLPGDEGSVFPFKEQVIRVGYSDESTLKDLIPPGTQSSRPVLIETWQWRLERNASTFAGAHVSYMDGHVEFVPLGTFPVVPSVMDGLCGVALEG